MADQSGRSVHQLKAETERTRAGLTDTVEQLRASVSETANEVRQRVSPTAIKAEISGYIQNRRDRLVDDVMSAARNNPMQAIAVGAAVGYPLLKLGRAIPLPILLIGAGLFLTSTKKGQALVHDAKGYAADFTDEAVARAQELRGQVSHGFEDVVGQGMEAARNAGEAVRGRVGQLGATVSAAQSAAKNFVGGSGSPSSAATHPDAPGYASQAADRVAGLRDQASRGARHAAETVRQTAAGAADSVSRATASALDTGMDAVKSARESAYSAARQANRTIGSTVQSNPLLVAGLGLVVGALIASSLPRTDVEDSLAGPTRDALKERAKNAAAEQFEHAKSAATDVIDSVVESAKREGFSAEGLDSSAQDIGQKIRRVADVGLSTAMKAAGEITESGGRKNG